MKTTVYAAMGLLLLASGAAQAKLPAPSDEAKAKAAEAAAKAAHGGKVDGYKLCKSMDQVAAAYFARTKLEAKTVKPATETPACVDPGAFVYSPPAAVVAGAAAPAAGTATAAAATAVAAPKSPAAPAAAATAAPAVKK